MKITNRLCLPQPLVDAVKNDPYSRGKSDISVTQLYQPPRKIALERQYEDVISEDASDRIWSLLGQSMHTILERANLTAIAERRFYYQCLGWTVSGQFDAIYSGGLLQDYKLCSAFEVTKGIKPDWIYQLNVGRVLIENEIDIKITSLQVVAILRDWSKRAALEKKKDGFPQTQVVLIDVPLWPIEKAKSYIEERVTLHQQARITLPECSYEDRWAKPNTFAVTKKGNKRADRVYGTMDEARYHASKDPANFLITERAAESVRCQFYCSVSAHCSQFKQMSEVVDD